MNLLKTFLLVFKAETKTAVKEIDALEKASKKAEKEIGKATDSTKKLKDQFEKTGKTFDEASDAVKESTDNVDKLVERLSYAAAAWSAFQITKAMITNTAEYNTQLSYMGRLMGLNAEKLKSLAMAAQAFGGSKEGALADISRLSNVASSMGMDLSKSGNPYDPLDNARKLLKGRSAAEKRKAMDMWGISDPGIRYQLSMMTDEQWEQSKSWSGRLTRLGMEDQAQAMERLRTKTGSDAARDDAATQGGSWWFRNVSNPFNELMSEHPWGALGAKIGGAIAATIGLGKLASGGLGMMGTSGGALASRALAGSRFGLPGLAGVAAYEAGTAAITHYQDPIERWLSSWMLSRSAHANMNNPAVAAAMARQEAGMDNMVRFWADMGYSPSQIAAIFANIKRESGGDPRAVGDNGLAVGIMQWHPDRRANILKNTGIDISSASVAEQMRAAAWEMKNGRPGFDDRYFRGLAGEDAASYFSQKFLAPANGDYEAMIRSQSALTMMGPISRMMGGGNSVNIENIEINTQATDAAGIAADLKESIYSQFSFTAGNFDDGVEK